jgi:hypothetical protein
MSIINVALFVLLMIAVIVYFVLIIICFYDKKQFTIFLKKLKGVCRNIKMAFYTRKAENNADVNDFFFLTEILNDLYKHGFVEGGKGITMLHDWQKELKQKCKKVIPGFVSKKRKLFDAIVGRQNW